MRKEDISCLDIETTGLDPMTDEILQISILDGNGKQLYNGYVKPTQHTEWEETTRINGITPEMVADAPAIREILPQIQGIFNQAELVVGYNCDRFDLAFLEQAGLEINTPTFDVMREYMPIAAEIDENGGYRRQNLRKCSAHYGYEGDQWHDSLADAKATLYCFYGVIRDRNWEIREDEIIEPTTMTAVLVEPGVPARIVEIDRGFNSLQAAVGGYIEEVHPSEFDEPCVLICNEEGIILNLPPNRALCDEYGNIDSIIRGNFLIVGTERYEYGSLTPRQAEKFCEHFRDPQVYRHQEELDRAREAAHEAGLPFSDRFYDGEDPDPYVFSDSMSLEDYELMHRLKNEQEDKIEPEYPDDHLTGDRVYTIRGSFQLTDLTYDQMQKAGYGIHHGSEDKKYWIMSNGTAAFAVRRDAPKPDTNITHEPPKGMKL